VNSPAGFETDPDTFFYTTRTSSIADKSLAEEDRDATFFAVKDPQAIMAAGIEPLDLESIYDPQYHANGSSVYMYHHAKGGPLQESKHMAMKTTSRDVYYGLDSKCGSSGAMVFSGAWWVALHKGEHNELMNQGTKASVVMKWLEEEAMPAVYVNNDDPADVLPSAEFMESPQYSQIVYKIDDRVTSLDGSLLEASEVTRLTRAPRGSK